MRIESMTATFGKLRTETLTLEPGLNILQMPNETGKSTWCAFILAMLYGVDTSERISKDNFPAKKHYAPWSGSAMEGRIELLHEGRRITIERSSTSRAPLGVFRAYDTESGQPIEELTAGNCGQILLGVPRQVFERSAFLRQDAAAISMDETLEQRLNALVTTGDETVSYQQAERQLRERLNRCRHNKTGLIPQTQAQLDGVNERLARLDRLHEALAEARRDEQRIRVSLSTSRMQLSALQARQIEARKAELREVGADAQQRMDRAKALEAECAGLPPVEAMERWEQALHNLEAEQNTLALDLASLPPAEAQPAAPAPLLGMDDTEILRQTKVDGARMRLLQAQKKPLPFWAIPALLLAGLSIFFFSRNNTVHGILSGILAAVTAVIGAAAWLHGRRAWNVAQLELRQLYGSYGVDSTDELEALSDRCRERYVRWRTQDAERNDDLNAMRAKKARLDADSLKLETAIRSALDEDLPRADIPAQLRSRIEKQLEYERMRRSAEQAVRHFQSLKNSVGELPIPGAQAVAVPEGKTIPALRAEIQADEHALAETRSVIDRCEGQCSTLGDRLELQAKQQELIQRLETLEEEYKALSMALTAIGKANEQLQNRFSPQLTALAGDYLSRLTDGAYDTLVLERDLGARVYTADNPASREAAYFSSGTRDQLYLAVRLAVSKMLSPGTPLILDDALVRFDDSRLRSALRVLQEEAKSRQVLLFTCQGRENDALEQL